MKIIHVLRKPLSEPSIAQNVLAHGCGSLNINTSRITPTTGRWPANLILQHIPSCTCLGPTQAPATSIHGSAQAIRQSSAHADAKGQFTPGRVQPVTGYANENGTETIMAYSCTPQCPVQNLNEQSGMKNSPKSYTRATGINKSNINWNPKKKETLQIGFGDSGYASRFFKQVL